MVVKRHKITTEFWNWNRKLEIKLWLVKNFGVNGDRWGEGLGDNFWMNEDVYVLYCLRWS
jgi:hypothetical protein